jgi:predicted alpha/beta-fold hydrolase
LGGNLVLKYLGEKGSRLPKEIDKAVAFSVPCDLLSTSIQFEAYGNYFYLKKFLKTMKEKMNALHEKALKMKGDAEALAKAESDYVAQHNSDVQSE